MIDAPVFSADKKVASTRRSSLVAARGSFLIPDQEEDGPPSSALPITSYRGSFARSSKKGSLEAALAKIRDYEQEITEKDQTIQHLRRTVKELSGKLKGVAQFIDLRDDIEERLEGLERRHGNEIEKYKAQASDARYDLLENKLRLKLEEKTLKEGFEKKVAEKAAALLSKRTKEIHMENFELLKDKLLFAREAEETRLKCEALEKENAGLRTELKVVTGSEKESLKRSTAFKKQVELLKNEVKSTEDQIESIAIEYTKRMETQTKQHDKQLQIALEERDTARSDALRLHTELQRLRTASSTVFSLYQDIQWFFHDALRQVRMEIVEERRQEIAAIAESAQRPGRRFPKSRQTTAERLLHLPAAPPPALLLSSPAPTTASPSMRASAPLVKGSSHLLALPSSPPHLLYSSSLRDPPTKSSMGRIEFNTSMRQRLLLTYENASCSSTGAGSRGGSCPCMDGSGRRIGRRRIENDSDPWGGKEKTTSIPRRRSKKEGSRSSSRGSSTEEKEVAGGTSSNTTTITASYGEAGAVPCFSLSAGSVGATSLIRQRSGGRAEWGTDKHGFPIVLAKPEDPILNALLPPLGSDPSSSSGPVRETEENRVAEGKEKYPLRKGTPKEMVAKEEEGIVLEKEDGGRLQDGGKGEEVDEEGRLLEVLAARWKASLSPANMDKRVHGNCLAIQQQGRKEDENDEEAKRHQQHVSLVPPAADLVVPPTVMPVTALNLPAHHAPLLDPEEREVQRVDVRQLTWIEKERVIFYLLQRLQQRPRALLQRRPKPSNPSPNESVPSSPLPLPPLPSPSLEVEHAPLSMAEIIPVPQEREGSGSGIEEKKASEDTPGVAPSKTFLTQW